MLSPSEESSSATGRPVTTSWASAERGRTVPPWLPPVVAALGAIALLVCLGREISHVLGDYLLDVGVFRDAGAALLHGEPLYSKDFPTRSGFRFIYPPFAALLFAPLAVLPEQLMEFLWTLASVAAVFGTMGMAVRRLELRPWWMWAVGLTGAAVWLEPIRAHLMYGQINIFLILIVAADIFGFMPRKLRGLGIGVAAGIKITPAAYAVVFLARRDWASVARSCGFFLLTAVIGFLVRAQESWYYWTVEFFRSDRGGPPPYPPNQALTGLLTRAGMSSDLATTIMGPGFLVIAALSVWGAFRLERAGHHTASFLLVILGICIANPIAVTHHWSGIVVAIPLFAVLVLRLEEFPLRTPLTVAVGALLLANVLGLHSLYPDEQKTFTFEPVKWLLGNSQGLTGIALFVVLLLVAARSQMFSGRHPLALASSDPASDKS